MGYSMIICQLADHLLIRGHAVGSIQYSTTLGQRVGLATYDRAATGWLVDHVKALLNSSGGGDVVLVADHDSIGRYPDDARLVRALYSVGDPVLSAAVDRMLKGENAAAEDLLAWFWEESRELPPAGIASLKGCVAKSGVTSSQWAAARKALHCHRALSWLALVAPDAADDEGCRTAVELLAHTDPVTLDDHQAVRSWLDVFQAPEADAFQRFCLGYERTKPA